MQNNQITINIARFIGLLLLQVIVLNHINFLGYINPYAYLIFILLFPFDASKTLLIFLSFLLGLSIDFFADSGGVHAAASVFVGFLRPVLLKFSFGVSYEYNAVKLNKVTFKERFLYITLMVFIHHFVLFSLEIFSASHLLLILKSTLFSGLFSVLLILCALFLFTTKET
tara:strand:- start:59892 stop:60401 length:510 start_codon:yes stop_codon:yes gene_type:complete